MQRKTKSWKKIVTIACCAVLIGGTGLAAMNANGPEGLTAYAAENQSIVQNDFEFVIKRDNTLELTRYNGTESLVDIPSVVKGRKVTSIGKGAFLSCGLLEQLTIPDTVTSIGNRAFAICKKLKRVTIPAGVMTIDKDAFGIKKAERIYVDKIFGASGSAAEQFADLNDIAFAQTFESLAPVVAESITLSQRSIQMDIGKTASLTASVTPDDAIDQTITWHSSNEEVAAMNNGIITAYSAGTAVITAKTANGLTAECSVTVNPPAAKITLNYNTAEMRVWDTLDLKATITPEDADSKEITWYTSNSSVVSVTNGRVAALKAGNAVVYAKLANGKTASCHITVQPKPSTYLRLDKTTVTLGKGEAFSFRTTTDGSDTIYWTSSNKSVATVSDGKVQTKGVGNTTITAKTASGATAKCIVVVKAAPSTVSLAKTTLSIGLRESYTLSAIIPDGTASYSRVFSSSNNSVVQMTRTDWSGKFVGTSVGTATITVRLYNGKTASCVVNVKDEPKSIQLSSTSLSMYVGDSASLSSTLPDGAAAAVRTYSTNNTSVLKMTKTDWTANFTALKAGTAIVTVKTYNGVQAQCKVTVTEKPREPVLPDRDLFLETARSYIGKDGAYVCKEKLKMGYVLDWCCFAVSAIMQDCNFIPKYQPAVYGVAPFPARYGDGITGEWFRNGEKNPQPGDLIFFLYYGCPIVDKYSCSHIGIVESVDGDIVTTLEGNVDGDYYNWENTSTFKRKTHKLSDSTVHSFFRPYWNK